MGWLDKMLWVHLINYCFVFQNFSLHSINISNAIFLHVVCDNTVNIPKEKNIALLFEIPPRSYFFGLALKYTDAGIEISTVLWYEPWISYTILLVHSNLCTTTIIGPKKQWTLLTGGRCSMVMYVKKAQNGTSKWWSLFVGGRKLRLDCTVILVLAVFHNFLAALPIYFLVEPAKPAIVLKPDLNCTTVSFRDLDLR